jgi:hypothetical protein
MSPDILLAATVVAPVLFLMVLRINAALVFLSLCLGSVLVQFVAPDVNSFMTVFSAHAPHTDAPDNLIVQLVLLLAPAALTAIFMIRTVKGHGRLLLNVLPAAGVGLLGVLLVIPLLSQDIADNLTSASLWPQVERSQNLIVGGSAVICLLVLWMQRPKTGGEKHGKKHKV